MTSWQESEPHDFKKFFFTIEWIVGSEIINSMEQNVESLTLYGKALTRNFLFTGDGQISRDELFAQKLA